MGKAADWLREERRKTLGDWVAFAACPQCAGEMRARCPACDARFSSAFAVDCEACGGALRPREQFGVRIRKPSS
jgi:predicted RNA-binding Zn-ribbon protein involved in translation (DUF1610 family)